MNPINLTVLLFKDGPWWVAQALEVDIASQGKSVDDAEYELQLAVSAFLAFNGVDAFLALPRAPERYWKQWAAVAPN